MRIGIIGAGFIGQGVAQLGIRNGHEVMVSNSRGPETLTSTIASLRCQAGTVAEAVAFGDMVLVAIPFTHIASLPAEMMAGKVVLDANNYYPERDGQIPELDSRSITTSEIVARHFPGARIVKAFNAILAADLLPDSRPTGAPDRRALPIAGDDSAAKALVATLQDSLGFDVVDAGPLCCSWRFERAKPAYCRPFNVAGLTQALAEARRDVELPHGSWRHG